MHRFSFNYFAIVLIATFVALLTLDVAPASAGTAYLSRTGTGNCTASPCANMMSGIAAAGISGEVVCLDKGNYGYASISQSITISCGEGLWANSSGVSIGATAGANVIIEGLVTDLEGSGTSALFFNGQGNLHLRRVRIGNTAGSSAHGISFTPNGPATLLVSDSAFYNSGSGAGISAGIYIKPASGVTAKVSVERSLFDSNNFGIVADGTGGGIIRGLVSDSFVSNNRNNGITVSTTSSSVVLTVDNTKVTGNTYGLVAGGGANAGMLVTRSTITANATGLFSSGGAALLSYGDNRVNANTTTDGAFTGTVGFK